MPSTMYIPLVNVSDAAIGEHSTFGRFMAKRICFVMLKMCMPIRENWSKLARSWREIRANLAQICIRKGRSRHKRTAQYE